METNNFLKKFKSLKFILLIAFVLIAIIFSFQKFKKDENTTDLIFSNKQEDTNSIQDSQEETDTSALASTEAVCVVYVSGEVNNPGVYELTSDSRIAEAIDKAGGATSEADLASINLADRVTDAGHIHINKKGEVSPVAVETAAGTSSSSAESKININTADKSLLMSLPGIGEQKAEAIIQYRNENGPFSKKEDIMKISGIKDASYSKFKDLISI